MSPRIALWALVGVFGLSAWTFSYAANGFADVEVQKAETYAAMQGLHLGWEFGSSTRRPCDDWKFDIASTSHASTTASSTRPWPPRPGEGGKFGTTTASSTHPRPPRPCEGFHPGFGTTTASSTRPWPPRPGEGGKVGTTTATTTRPAAPKPGKPPMPPRPGSNDRPGVPVR